MFTFRNMLGAKLYGEADTEEVPIDEVDDNAPKGEPKALDEEETPPDDIPDGEDANTLTPDNDGEDVSPVDGEDENDGGDDTPDDGAFTFEDTSGLDEEVLKKRSKQVTKWLNNNLNSYKKLMVDIDNADMYPEKRGILQPLIDQYKEVIELYDSYMLNIDKEDELSKIEKSLEFRALFIALNEQLSQALVELSESEGR